MKAIILAALMVVLYLCVVTVAFRLSQPGTLRARLMMRVFFLTIPFGAAVFWATPHDLGFLPPRWIEEDQTVAFAFWLFLYCAIFFGGILQLYNLADRGFSLRIAMDIDQSPDACMTGDQVVKCYSSGKGIAWMYQKRIDDLLRLKLIEVQDDLVEATAAGKRIAAQFSWLRQFLRVIA